MDDIPQPHDKLFRRSMQEKAIAIDFLRASLPSDILGETNLSTLASANGDFLQKGLVRSQSDAVYRCKISNSSAYILAEHQSSADPMMAFRLLRYQVDIMTEHLRQGHEKLPIIVSLVLYHGTQSPYPYSTEIWDCFEDPELAKRWALRPFRLLDLTQITDEEIERRGLASTMQIVLKHHRDQQTNAWVRRMIAGKNWAILAEKVGPEYQYDVAVYIVDACDSENLDQTVALLVDAIPKKREDIMTIAHQLEQRGMQQGMQQGTQRGMQQKSIEVAKRMLSEGLDRETVKRCTGLTDSDLPSMH